MEHGIQQTHTTITTTIRTITTLVSIKTDIKSATSLENLHYIILQHL